MNIHVGKRLFVVAAVLGAVAVLATGFFVAVGVRSVVAGPGASPVKPNPGHEWSEIGLPPGTWPGLDAELLGGKDDDDFWQLDGNTGTNPPTDFVGTTDPQPLVIKTYDTEAMRVDTEGDVGIGTDNPLAGLHVHEWNELDDDVPDILVERDSTWPAGSPRLGLVDTWSSPVTTAPAWIIDNIQDRLRIFRQDNIFEEGVPPAFMTIRNSGNVGIGTDDPLERLDVRGNINADADGTETHISLDGGGYGTAIYGTMDGAGAGLRFFTQSDGTFSEKMRITKDGKVGIGTMSPQRLLEVGRPAGDVQVRIGTGGVAKSVLEFWTAGYGAAAIGMRTSNDGLFLSGADWDLDTAANVHMAIRGNGKVGIGTIDPGDYKLNVQGGTGNAVYGETSGAATTNSAVYGHNTSNGAGVRGDCSFIGCQGVYGENTASGIGVYGKAGTNGTGLKGEASGSAGLGLEVVNVMRLRPTDDPGNCDSGRKGSVYFDDSLSELCDCDGTSWQQVDGGGACSGGSAGSEASASAAEGSAGIGLPLMLMPVGAALIGWLAVAAKRQGPRRASQRDSRGS